MSFTQEKETNIKVCTGCDKRCEFGFSVEEFTTTANGMTMHYETTYPTLAGKIIRSYKDRFGRSHNTGSDIVNGKILSTMQEVNVQWRQLIQDSQLEQAFKIAQLCDHYKTR